MATRLRTVAPPSSSTTRTTDFSASSRPPVVRVALTPDSSPLRAIVGTLITSSDGRRSTVSDEVAAEASVSESPAYRAPTASDPGEPVTGSSALATPSASVSAGTVAVPSDSDTLRPASGLPAEVSVAETRAEPPKAASAGAVTDRVVVTGCTGGAAGSTTRKKLPSASSRVTRPTPLTACTISRTSLGAWPSGRAREPYQSVESSTSCSRSSDCHDPWSGPASAVYVVHTCWMPADGSPTTRASTRTDPSGSSRAVTRLTVGGAARAGVLSPYISVLPL